MRWSWVLLVLAACGMSEDKFQDRFSELSCEALFECTDDAVLEFLPFDSVDSCMKYMGLAWSSIPDDCDYDPAAAKRCIKEVQDLSCDGDNDTPSACEDVYDGCGLFGG